MAVMNDVQQSTEPKSPTTLVMQYLQSKGISPSAQSIRTALQENARNGGKLIPGLINQDPGEDENSPAPKGGPGVGRGGGGSVANKVESSTGPNYGGGTADTRSGDQRGGGSSSGGGDQKTSAPPPAATLPLDDRDPPLAALNRAENPRLPSDVKNIYADDPELGPGGALGAGAGLGGLGGALGVGGAGLAAAIMNGQGLPRVLSGGPPVTAQPPGVVAAPAGGPQPLPGTLGADLVPEAPNVPFNSAGPRVAPAGPPDPRLTPPGITLQPPPNPNTIAPSAMGPEGPPAPNVPFNSAGPRVAPTAPLMPRGGPPGLNFVPTPGAGAPGAPVESEIAKLLRGLAGAGKRFRP